MQSDPRIHISQLDQISRRHLVDASALNSSEAKRLRFGRSRLSNEMPVKHHQDILCANRSSFLGTTPKTHCKMNTLLRNICHTSYGRHDKIMVYFADKSVILHLVPYPVHDLVAHVHREIPPPFGLLRFVRDRYPSQYLYQGIQ